MVAYSKVLPYTCYEIGHTWNADCSGAVLDAVTSTMKGSMKIYAVVYLLAALFKWKKISKSMAIEIFKNYIRSVSFLTMHAGAFISFFCIFRKMLGHVNFLSVAIIPSIIASLSAIMVETPRRRTLLASYVTNVASACMWNAVVGRKYISPVKNGEVLIFMLGMAMLSYYKSTDNATLQSLFTFLLGKKSNKGQLDESKKPEIISSRNINRSNAIGRYLLPPVPGYLQSILLAFAKGYSIRVALNLLSSTGKIFRKPSALKNIVFQKEAFNAGLFLATFTGTFKTVSWLTGKYQESPTKQKIPTPSNDCLAGFCAGMSMFWFPSSTIALCSFWKGLEMVYSNLSKDGYLPHVPFGSEIVYCISTVYLFHVAIFEPQHLKSSYWKFLQNLSEGRISEFNRKVLDVYGLDSGLTQKWPQYRDINRLSVEFRNAFAHEFPSA